MKAEILKIVDSLERCSDTHEDDIAQAVKAIRKILNPQESKGIEIKSTSGYDITINHDEIIKMIHEYNCDTLRDVISDFREDAVMISDAISEIMENPHVSVIDFFKEYEMFIAKEDWAVMLLEHPRMILPLDVCNKIEKKQVNSLKVLNAPSSNGGYRDVDFTSKLREIYQNI